MKEKKKSKRRLFTVEEANARLPLVRAITRDLSDLARDLVDRRQRLDSLLAGRKLSATDVYSDELADMYKAIERDTRKLEDYVKELQALGVEAKGAIDGLVDFPSMLEGREVYLCWRLGEPEVLYWHDVDAGFAGRQPLVVAASTGDSDSLEIDDDSNHDLN
jgi:hypothetical protein